MNAYQSRYLNVWKKAFIEFLDWDPEKTTDWAGPLLKQMDLPGMVINEGPLFYVARELASQQTFFDQLSQRERFELIEALQKILMGKEYHDSFPADYDFAEAKIEVQKILSRQRG